MAVPAKINAPPYFTIRRYPRRVSHYFAPPPARRPGGWPELAEPWPAGVKRSPSPRLSDDLGEALGQAQALYHAMQSLRGEVPKIQDAPPGSIPWLIRELLESPLHAERVEGWSDAHRKNTLRNLEWWQGISARLAASVRKMALDDVQAHHHLPVNVEPAWTAKAISMALAQPAIKEKLPQRRALRASLSLLLGVAVVEGYLDRNPALDVRLSVAKTTFHAYTDDEVLALIEAAPQLGLHGEAMARVIALMSETGQREGDALRLQYGRDYRGGEFRFRQSKTGAVVNIPATGLLREMIGLGDDSLGTIAGWPYSADHLRHEFARLRGIARLPATAKLMHLRHRAVMRMRELGFEALAISSITGHSPGSVNQMLDRHYSTPTSEQARAVVARIDQHRKGRES